MDSYYPWQEAMYAALAEQARRDRLHHALLLVGEPGIGKRDLALAFAAYLLCRSPAGDDPCGECGACHLVTAGNHPDLFLLEPDESRFILIDEIRELAEWIGQTAQQGGRKVVVLHPAEMINHAASNALLKSLEEPSPDTTLLLVCNRLSGLLPTIRSRCQRHVMQVPPRAQAEAWLAGEGVADAEVQALLDFTRGRPLAARALAGEAFLEQRDRMVSALVEIRRGRVSPVDAAAALGESDPGELLNLLMYWFADLLKFRLAGRAAHVANGDVERAFGEMAEGLDEQALLHMLDRVTEERALMVSSVTPNVQLVLENVMIEWARTARA